MFLKKDIKKNELNEKIEIKIFKNIFNLKLM